MTTTLIVIIFWCKFLGIDKYKVFKTPSINHDNQFGLSTDKIHFVFISNSSNKFCNKVCNKHVAVTRYKGVNALSPSLLKAVVTKL